MRLSFFLSILSISIFISCNSGDQATSNTFTLNGITTSIPDSTFIRLENTVTKVSDSAYILGNKFSFTGQLESPTEEYILIAPSLQEYKFLWLEPGEITLDASTSNLINSLVTGSETELVSQELFASLEELDNEENVLGMEFSQKNAQGTLKPGDEMAFYEKMDELRIKRSIKEQAFIKEHPSTIVSSKLLYTYTSSWGKETTQDLFNGLSEEQQNSFYGQQIQEYINLNINPEVGDAFADFTMKNEVGEDIKLSDYKGKLVLLEFWASWCAPCREENPELKATYEKYHPKGFEILAVSLDQSKESWLKAIEQDELPWQHVSDLKGQQNLAAIIYGIAGIPDNFLIGPDGTIIARDLRGEALPNKLEEAIS